MSEQHQKLLNKTSIWNVKIDTSYILLKHFTAEVDSSLSQPFPLHLYLNALLRPQIITWGLSSKELEERKFIGFQQRFLRLFIQYRDISYKWIVIIWQISKFLYTLFHRLSIYSSSFSFMQNDKKSRSLFNCFSTSAIQPQYWVIISCILHIETTGQPEPFHVNDFFYGNQRFYGRFMTVVHKHII